MNLTILCGDALEKLRGLEPESVNCCVTSPPYYGLRDYGVDGQIGLEKTPQEYVARLVQVFEEVRRVLRKDGTLWVNLGDSYARQAGDDSKKEVDSGFKTGRTGKSKLLFKEGCNKPPNGLKAKDLIGIPWMVAFALRDAGWWLRSDIIWAKANCMPESVTDRPTRSHEYIFLLSKSARYFYDAEAIKEPAVTEPHAAGYKNGEEYAVGPMNRNGHSQREGDQTRVWGKRKEFNRDQGGGGTNFNGHSGNFKPDGTPFDYVLSGLRNKRDVWSVNPMPYADAHFATFPPDLIKPCILAGCQAGGVVLDPFAGSGTTGQVALELGRKAVLIELNPDYVKLIEQRTNVTPGFVM